MFQNISNEIYEEKEEYIKESKIDNIKRIAREMFSKQNLALYITTFMVSTVNLRDRHGSFWTSYVCSSM